MTPRIRLINELPFALEIPDDMYDILTDKGIVVLGVNSNLYKLFTARFADLAQTTTYYIDSKEKLESLIQKFNIPNYAFDKCKTCIKYEVIGQDITFDDIQTITDEQCIEYNKLVTFKHLASYINDTSQSSKINISNNELEKIRTLLYVKKICDAMLDTDIYYEALNNLIYQCRNLNRPKWIYKVDTNILGGTLVHYMLDRNTIYQYIYCDNIRSLNNHNKILPQMNECHKQILINRLETNYRITSDEELMLEAETLYHNLNYRSAILESSAALEIAVGNKIKQKMKLAGKSDTEIENYFAKHINFKEKCQELFKIYNKKFNEEDQLWKEIKLCRITYRNTIAHSGNIPDKITTAHCLYIFSKGIEFVHQLR